MSFLVRSFLSLIPVSFRHHHVFSKVRKHSVLVFFKKRSQMLHSTHEGPLTQTWSPARKRMNDRKKKKRKNRDTLGTMQIHSTKQYWRWEGGCFGFGFGFFWVLVFGIVLFSFFFFFFWQLPLQLINATAFPQLKETQAALSCPPPPPCRSPTRWCGHGRLSLGWPGCHGPQARWGWNLLGLLCLQNGQKSWLPWATPLKAVAALNLTNSPDLLGGINLFECK